MTLPWAPDHLVRAGREAGLVGGCPPPSCFSSPLGSDLFTLFSLLLPVLFCSLLEGKGGWNLSGGSCSQGYGAGAAGSLR